MTRYYRLRIRDLLVKTRTGHESLHPKGMNHLDKASPTKRPRSLRFLVLVLALASPSSRAFSSGAPGGDALTDRFYMDPGLSGFPGDTIRVSIGGTNSEAIKGYSINLAFDGAVLECVGLPSIDDTRAAGSAIFTTKCDVGDATAGVVYSFGCPLQIEPGTGAFLRLDLRIAPNAVPGVTQMNLLDDAPALNRMTLCDGATRIPALNGTAITVIDPTALGGVSWGIVRMLFR